MDASRQPRPSAQSVMRALGESRVIAAARNAQGVAEAARSNAQVVFLLGGDVLLLPDWVARLRHAHKKVFVHMDLVDGIGRDAAGVRFIKRTLDITGVISTRAQVLKAALDQELCTVQRAFLIDSASLAASVRAARSGAPDFLEVMPGVIPKAIEHIRDTIDLPVIAGGMVEREGEALAALGAGAIAVSTSSRALWDMRLT